MGGAWHWEGACAMSPGNFIQNGWEAVPIVMLLLAGGAIAVLSGVGRWGSIASAWRLALNASVVLLRTLAYVIALLAVQQMIGSAPGRGW